jgi:hypothetical protein
LLNEVKAAEEKQRGLAAELSQYNECNPEVIEKKSVSHVQIDRCYLLHTALGLIFRNLSQFEPGRAEIWLTNQLVKGKFWTIVQSFILNDQKVHFLGRIPNIKFRMIKSTIVLAMSSFVDCLPLV